MVRLQTAGFALLIPLLASACVTVTPAGQVASVPTLVPASTLPTQMPSFVSGSIATPSASFDRSVLPNGSPRPTFSATRPPPSADAADPACSDDSYTLEGFSWNRPYYWHFNSSTTPPDYDSADVLAAIKRGVENITSERNDCGRPDHIFERMTYQGDLTLSPCSPIGDGVNVIGFGKIPTSFAEDAIAYTCPYTYKDNGEIEEADVVISDSIPWAFSADSCFLSFLLEPVITHEMGHVLGMDHVSEHLHSDLTMSTKINTFCDDSASTLGLGDMLGLESLYGGN